MRKRKGSDGGEEEGKTNDHEMRGYQFRNEAAFLDLGGAQRGRKRYVGVHQRPSGRWVAEIKDTIHKIRVWLGTFDTAVEAARAYDEAACILHGSNTRTNFWLRSHSNSQPTFPPKISNLLLRRLQARNNSTDSIAMSLHGHQQCQETAEAHDSYQPDILYETLLDTTADKIDNENLIKSSLDDYFVTKSNLIYSGKEAIRVGELDMQQSWSNYTNEVLNADYYQTEGKAEEENNKGIMDLHFLNAVKQPYDNASVNMAGQIEDRSDEALILTEPMKRIKYECKFSSSLYAFNELSSKGPRLKLRSSEKKNRILRPEQSPNISMTWNLEDKKDYEDQSGSHFLEQLGDNQQARSTSYSTSSSNECNEWSIWSSLDLPPITMLFGD